MLSRIQRSVFRYLSYVLIFLSVAAAFAQQPPPREFPPGTLNRLDELPDGRLRWQLDLRSTPVQERARQWLNSFHFTEHDVTSLHADAEGGIFYVCNPAPEAAPAEAEVPPIGQAAVPVSPFPASLVFHSRPGAPNVLYLNFTGETVTNTQWNTEISRTVIPAVAFSTDGDLSTFSDAEQLAIKRIWQRVAEDYAPFNIDVTTERPVTFTTRTAHALITRNTDANGAANPFSNSGGVAYVNVFGTSTYAKYRPGWIYQNNLANDESYIAEATSHEIGHNLGLSHDGKTDGSEYYGGHGSGDISWGPLMGTGYNRNVSQWSKGNYYLANNTQDDLATVAGKISYRTDDHGNTPGTATALTLAGGTNIVSTTPELDPTNTNPGNKGVFERNTDLDVFSFVTGNGAVSLSVKPWIMPSGTRGGNLDVRLELYNEAGALLLTNNPASQTLALIQTNLAEGRYYLHVRNSGAGSPLSSTPSGYTTYGSIGQFFISGYVTEATGFVVPPVAELQVADLTQSGQGTKEFTVTYSDNVAVNVLTIDTNDVRILGPNGYDRAAQLVSLSSSNNGTPRVATYAAEPPTGGVWSPSANGTYTIWMQTNQVGDTEGVWVAAGQLGQFNVVVPATLYTASMNVNPGWTLEPQWEYGTPAYTGGGPTSGFTGTSIIGYNLSGNYENRLDTKYATTPVINCSGSTSVTLRFRRWLRTRNNDTASIQASTIGTTWINVWSSSSRVSDNAWQEVQYTLPAGIAGSPAVRLRWGLASNPAQDEIGWNIDDVELLGDGSLDTTTPVPALSVADVTLGGSPSHSCSVTYTDDTAVRLSTLDSSDVLVTGPNGYSNLVEFVGADLPADGTPVTATYSIPAPGGSWDTADNGLYQVELMENEVEDTFNNAIPQTALGSFSVTISTVSPGVLAVTPVGGLSSSGNVGGPFNPSSMNYTLTNSGGSTLNWTASKAQNWVNLSTASGSLAPGEATNVIVSLNASAANLTSGDHIDTVSFINTTSGDVNTSRSVSLTISPAATNVELTVTVNNPAWGSVSPTNGSYVAGSSVELLATPATYYRFHEWNGAAAGTNNPLMIVLNANTSVLALFGEVFTTNHPTPHWWLAEHGYTNDLETAVTNVGANGFALWQSYIAGLNPSDPDSQLRLTLEISAEITESVLRWSTFSGRVYSVWCSTNLLEGFVPLNGATNLAWTVQSVTNEADSASSGTFYRLEAWKP